MAGQWDKTLYYPVIGRSCQILNLTDNKKFGGEDVWNNAYLQDFRRRFLAPDFPLLFLWNGPRY
jgi:hypothetical protein